MNPAPPSAAAYRHGHPAAAPAQGGADPLQALLFDVDGTLAETEETHRLAFNAIFAAAGLPWHWDVPTYRRLLAVTGGRERIAAWMDEIAAPERARADCAAWIAELHARKTRRYGEMLAAGQLELRPGVRRLLEEARAAGLRLAIVTTTSHANLPPLFAAALPKVGAQALDWFEVVVTGEQVKRKKPDPEAYALALDRLGLTPAACLAIEDTVNGLRAAQGAGLAVLITEGLYSQGDDFSGALRVVPHLDDDGSEAHQPVTLATLARWHAQRDDY